MVIAKTGVGVGEGRMKDDNEVEVRNDYAMIGS